MKYMGPTEASRRPRPSPWLFRGNNDLIALTIAVGALLAWIWS